MLNSSPFGRGEIWCSVSHCGVSRSNVALSLCKQLPSSTLYSFIMLRFRVEAPGCAGIRLCCRTVLAVLHSATGKKRVNGFLRVLTLSLARFKAQPQKGMRKICSCQDNTLMLEKTTHGTAIALGYYCGTANCY